jgi:hypothetical protein
MERKINGRMNDLVQRVHRSIIMPSKQGSTASSPPDLALDRSYIHILLGNFYAFSD